MSDHDTPLLLDVTRSVSRIGAGGDSGVDRVERAYIRALMAQGRPVFFLAKVLRGVALLDREGMRALLDLAADPARLGPPDLWGHLARKQSPARRRAETAVRKLALGWAFRAKTAALVRAHLGKGFSYINVGHTHLDAAHLARMRDAGCARIAIMIHDVIPLDFPEYSRPEAPARFEKLLRTAASAADLLIYNSQDTANRTEAWLKRWGMEVPGAAALLGVDPLDENRALPAPEAGAHPHFVMLGTIEPRKNHLLMLSIWRHFHDTLDAADTPHLYIIGRRGWENEQIVDVLDRAPYMGRTVFETGFIPDAEMTRLLASARALLFPSFAEGFGYPLAEAQQLGIPAICADLPVYRELAGDQPTYLDPLDGPGWARAILDAAGRQHRRENTQVAVPNWETHFDVVLRAV
ncbi:glycosyltransferase family 4 protein [Oceanibium sediminis]|uniref:glycosyltransferase family 4 protein n=1 Tax=Oceanibium sediminis TaxID=2026339 RepID=UPI001300A27F|nr:glycosyltransferase family 1 protein [Oceanibium sediminis]